jgi:hypothetical protein
MIDLYENLFDLLRDIVIKETGIDVTIPQSGRKQKVVNAKIIFIGVLIKYYQNTDFPTRNVSKYIRMSRSNVSVHYKNIITNNKIIPFVRDTIDNIVILIKVEKKLTLSLKDLLLEHKQYLLNEIDIVNKLLIEYERTIN